MAHGQGSPKKQGGPRGLGGLGRFIGRKTARSCRVGSSMEPGVVDEVAAEAVDQPAFSAKM
eukprot:10163897-Alexandrium_andersonii.AAC.1